MVRREPCSRAGPETRLTRRRGGHRGRAVPAVLSFHALRVSASPRDDLPFLALVGLAGLGGELLGLAIAVGQGAVAELLADVVEPFLLGEGVGAELLQLPFFFAEEEGTVLPQLARGRRVDQGARVVGAHLEQDADLEFAEPLAVERAVEVV